MVARGWFVSFWKALFTLYQLLVVSRPNKYRSFASRRHLNRKPLLCHYSLLQPIHSNCSPLSSISSFVETVSRRWVVIWNALIKPYRLVLLPRPNIDLLPIDSTREGSRKSSPAPKSLQTFSIFQENDQKDLQHRQYQQHYQWRLPRLWLTRIIVYHHWRRYKLAVIPLYLILVHILIIERSKVARFARSRLAL